METGFRDWLRCPTCEHDSEPSVLAFQTTIVFECYGCGLVAEFEIGEDIPLHDLDRGTTDGD